MLRSACAAPRTASRAGQVCACLVVCLALATGCVGAGGDERTATGAAAPKGLVRIADGSLQCTVGDYALGMGQTYAWTIRSLSYRGVSLMTDRKGCSNGTVLRAHSFVDAARHPLWVGTGHGNETVESVALIVDGKERPIDGDCEYTGSDFRVVKRSDLKVFTLEATTRLTASGLSETHRYTAKADSPPLALLYCFMHSFDVGMLDWLVHRTEGSVARGTFANRGKFPLRSDGVDWAAVYNATAGVGAVYAVRKGSGRLHHFIWDRPFDQKLYYHAHPNVDAMKAGDILSYSVALVGFQSDAGDWEARATALALDLQAQAAGGQ